MISSIQALRAFAAISVVIYHAGYFSLVLSGRQHDQNPFDPLASGVDLFFVISGFMMVHSSGRLFGQPGAGKDFLLKRVARVIPFYWATTMIVALMSRSDIPSIAKSLLFIPYTNENGSMNPIHGVGWTLNFEMLFYAVFAVCVALPKWIAVSTVSLVLVVLVVAGRLLHLPYVPLIFWSDPIVLEFLFGMWIAMMCGRIELADSARLAIVGIAAAFIWWHVISTGTPTGSRALVWGVPAALIVAATVLTKPRQTAPTLTTLGDASYLIYLLHPIAYDIVLMFWGTLQNYGMSRVLGVAILSAIAASVILSLTIEKPITRWVRDLLERVVHRRAVRVAGEHRIRVSAS